jgi:type IV secretory pathway VirB2 component (pilin)
MRHARPPRWAVILVCGVLGLLAYSAGLHLPWEVWLQWILLTVQGPGARAFALAVLVIAAVVLAFGDVKGGARRWPQLAFGLCIAFARWLVGDAFGGISRDERMRDAPALRGEPRVSDAENTASGSYYLEMRAAHAAGFLAASWGAPGDTAAAVSEERLPLDRLNFRYDITGGKPPWRPLRAFDDGEKVYIQFPNGVSSGERPSLFAASGSGSYKPLEYRIRGSYAIANRLFDSAELRSGDQRERAVRIRCRRIPQSIGVACKTE